MKRITKSIVAVFAITTMLVSCTKDKTETSSIEGKWILNNIAYTIPNSAPETDDMNVNCPIKNYLDVQTAGALEQGDVDGDTCELTKANGTWKKTNNSVDMTIEGEKVTFEITSLTTSKLALKLTDLGSDSGYPAGTTAVLNFSK